VLIDVAYADFIDRLRGSGSGRLDCRGQDCEFGVIDTWRRGKRAASTKRVVREDGRRPSCRV